MKTSVLADVSTYSIERLIRMAVSRGLLTDYIMTPRRVMLRYLGIAHDMEPEEARLYLACIVQQYPTVSRQATC